MPREITSEEPIGSENHDDWIHTVFSLIPIFQEILKDREKFF
jgi:hypothetical protein